MLLHRILPVAYDQNHVCSIISEFFKCLHCFCVHIRILLKYYFVFVNFFIFSCTSFAKINMTYAWYFSLESTDSLKLYYREKYLMSCQRSNSYLVHLCRIKITGSPDTSPSTCHVGL